MKPADERLRSAPIVPGVASLREFARMSIDAARAQVRADRAALAALIRSRRA